MHLLGYLHNCITILHYVQYLLIQNTSTSVLDELILHIVQYQLIQNTSRLPLMLPADSGR